MSSKPVNEFEQAAVRQERVGIVREFGYFLLHRKKWWLLPILLILLMGGVLIALSGTAVAPFIYTLF